MRRAAFRRPGTIACSPTRRPPPAAAGNRRASARLRGPRPSVGASGLRLRRLSFARPRGATRRTPAGAIPRWLSGRPIEHGRGWRSRRSRTPVQTERAWLSIAETAAKCSSDRPRPLPAKTSAGQSTLVGASSGLLRLSQLAKWAILAPKRRSKRPIPTPASRLLILSNLHLYGTLQNSLFPLTVRGLKSARHFEEPLGLL